MIRAAVLGADVSKSRSPAIHQAAFAALGIEGQYVAISVDGRGFRATVRQLAEQGYRYLNVTIPHKRAAAALADSASPLVAATRAANTLILRPRAGKRVRGENTDGYGLLTALGDLGVKVKAGQIHVLVGSGGAAAGGLAALVAAGATVRVVARRTAPARALGRGLPVRQRGRVQVFPWTPAGLATALDGAQTLISAVPAAAWQGDEARAGLRGLDRKAAVLEMAYGATTPLATAARDRVARYQDGIPMLVHQAARAVELALGEKPPAEPLLKAARG
jgi:shikimate dehydrogenase